MHEVKSVGLNFYAEAFHDLIQYKGLVLIRHLRVHNYLYMVVLELLERLNRLEKYFLSSTSCVAEGVEKGDYFDLLRCTLLSEHLLELAEPNTSG